MVGRAAAIGALLALGLGCGRAAAFSTGPANGLTGAPGEGTCANCHGNLNTGSGTLAIDHTGPFTPGSTLAVRVDLAQTGQRRWGFEITALGADGLPVGDFVLTDALNTQKSTAANGRQYVKQTSAGTYAGTFDVSPGWSFQWQAPPATMTTVTFYAAANAANGNGTSGGDFIYTRSLTLDQSATAVPERPDFFVAQNVPNPFNPATTIRYHLDRAGSARLRIHDLAGRLVRTLREGELPAGPGESRWDGNDSRGLPAPSGTYLCVLESGGRRLSRTLALVR
jgi:hypothetical protein